MNPNLTEIAFVLDRSGSMESMKSEAIGGFNHFLDQQKNEPGEVRFTLVLFDHEYDKLVDHEPLTSVRPLNDSTFVPRGPTALLDAVGRTIDEIGQRLASTPEHARPSKVIVACMTDGNENASKHYTNAKVAEMIEHQRIKYSWDFVFLGATLQSREMARSWTISEADIAAFENVPEKVGLALRHSLHMRVSEKRKSR